ncbi:sigma-70 family RNA polymerase sigma factor [Leptothoe sp. PORK10 BA2]|uniref:sigma-70 family RNA polymerase sigma factor n=1 Tax=Leptothoe sp. PORK10 BA2 TaxID=3110254 RepID=UPI003FA3599B
MTTIELDAPSLSSEALNSIATISAFQTLQSHNQKLAAEQLNQLDLAELINLCQGDRYPAQAPFSELMRRYKSHVDRQLYHLAPDWSDRSDLAQEVWIRVYRNLHRLQSPVKFKGWMSRITTNLFYDELRKRKRHAGTLSLDAPRHLDDGQVDWEIASEEPSPVDTMMTHEFYDRLQSAIADLPEVFRTTIVLREIQGLPYDEIAEITGVSLGTVKSRIARARYRLQGELKRYVDGQQSF